MSEPKLFNELILRAMPQLPTIGIGVRGLIRPGDPFVIEMIQAEVEGNGAVSRFLDELPKNKSIRVETVINPALAHMLLRRGFVNDGNDNFTRQASE